MVSSTTNATITSTSTMTVPITAGSLYQWRCRTGRGGTAATGRSSCGGCGPGRGTPMAAVGGPPEMGAAGGPDVGRLPCGAPAGGRGGAAGWPTPPGGVRGPAGGGLTGARIGGRAATVGGP